VTVIVTAYQHAAYIDEAIASVLGQRTSFPVEVLVGDDGSDDGTQDAITARARSTPLPVDLAFRARNRGDNGTSLFLELCARARGEYIAWLDGDDAWIDDGKLERQVDVLREEPRLSACYHNVLVRHEDGSRPDHLFNGADGARDLGLEDLLARCPIASCSPMFRAEVLRGLPAWYAAAPWGDLPAYIHAATLGPIRYLPRVMGMYRVHHRGMYSSRASVDRRRDEVAFFTLLERSLPARHVPAVRTRLARALDDLGRERMAAGQVLAGLQQIAAGWWRVPPASWRHLPHRLRQSGGAAAWGMRAAYGTRDRRRPGVHGSG